MDKDTHKKISDISKRLERIEMGIVLILKNIELSKKPIDAYGKPYNYENRGNGGTQNTMH